MPFLAAYNVFGELGLVREVATPSRALEVSATGYNGPWHTAVELTGKPSTLAVSYALQWDGSSLYLLYQWHDEATLYLLCSLDGGITWQAVA